MKAGRELDALVAEKVMGWEIAHFQDEPLAVGWCGYWDGDWFRWTTRPLNDDLDEGRDWHPSTRIEDAWQVVEKMGRWNAENDLEETGVQWQFWTDFGTINRQLHSAVADTAQLAICLAALKAVGEDV